VLIYVKTRIAGALAISNMTAISFVAIIIVAGLFSGAPVRMRMAEGRRR
jgi:uncharacterized membrane protein YcaP (DUF421 family)